MIKTEYLNRVRDFLTSSKTVKLFYLITFTVFLTAIVASQNFFFQSIIENGISKKDIVAQKTLTVEDVKRTEQHKREVAQKVEPILVPAEDDFIKSNLETIQNSVLQIRKKNSTEKEKIDEMIQVAIFAESWKNSQTPRYHVIQSKEMLKQFKEK